MAGKKKKFYLLDEEKLKTLYRNDSEGLKRYVKAKWRTAAACLAAMLFGLLSLILQDVREDTGRIMRPSLQEGTQEQMFSLELKKNGERWAVDVEIEIQPQTYEQEQAMQYLNQAAELLEERCLGENVSYDEVRDKLILPSYFESLPVTVKWDMDLSLISTDGSISEIVPEEGIETVITANLSCSEQTKTLSIPVTLYPRVKTELENIRGMIEADLQQNEENQRMEQFYTIPGMAAGYQLQTVKEGPGWKALLFIPVILLGVVYLLRIQTEQDLKKRSLQLQRAYPDFVDQILLYLRAGLPIYGAWRRLSDAYKEQKDQQYLYREIQVTLHEMENGISVERALEQFGQRCQLSVYMKFAFLLSQNVRKGTNDLPAFLEYEAKEAMEQRRSLIRQKGEEAGTKLLFPMMVMMLIVFMLLLIPAFRQL